MRHPVVTASMATTLNRLSNGRFALGLAKGVGLRWKMLNVPFPTYEREREFIDVMRRLWRGEPVLREYERIRPAHLFAGRSNRPA